MNSIVIGDNEYKLPTDYTIGEYVRLHNIGWDNPTQFMSTAFNIPKDEIELLPTKQLELGGALVYSLLYPIGHPDAFETIELHNLPFGKFIDCEMMLEGGNNKLVDLCQLLFEEKITTDTPISKVYDGYQKYIKYRNLLYYQYRGLFSIDDDEGEVVEIQQSNPPNKAHIWMDMVMILSNDDFLKMNQVVERPVIECFNYLAYTKDKRMKELEQQRRKQLEARMR